jgi:hypothetical protein
LAANVAVAEPTLTGRIIAAWPSFALTASFELLTRQVRRSAPAGDRQNPHKAGRGRDPAAGPAVRAAVPRPGHVSGPAPLRGLQRQAWQWALANRASDGSLPAGREIAREYGRRERWGRLVKNAGLAGEFADIIADESASEVITPRPAA